MKLRPKDYLQTADDLFCAVISDRIEQACVPVTFRYYRDKARRFHKLQDEAANRFLRCAHAHYIRHSAFSDGLIHAVPLPDIHTIWRPESGRRRLLQASEPDSKQRDARDCIRLLLGSGVPVKRLGITGSLLIDAHNERSDIDLVVYGRDHFFTVRQYIHALLRAGKIAPLDRADWRTVYVRRHCALGFDEYCVHERRKYNKFICGASRIDLSLLPLPNEWIADTGPFEKRGFTQLLATVVEDQYSYDYPARYTVDHAAISEIVSYTATYAGQATAGDRIEAAGYIEQDATGRKRLLVGTSRAAGKEYIKRKP